MKEFTEDERIVAKNISKEYKWMARDSDGDIYIYIEKPTRLGNGWNASSDFCEFRAFNHMFKSIIWENGEPTLIKNIYDPQILDDVEMGYLRTVLRPFHDDVKYVVKHRDAHFDENTHDQEFLFISLEDGTFTFPDFDEGKMYSGMEVDKKYELHELGITYTDTEEAQNE
ncbi:MAG: hypothetical protein ACI4ET_07195 [Bilifractor sp.]